MFDPPVDVAAPDVFSAVAVAALVLPVAAPPAPPVDVAAPPVASAVPPAPPVAVPLPEVLLAAPAVFEPELVPPAPVPRRAVSCAAMLAAVAPLPLRPLLALPPSPPSLSALPPSACEWPPSPASASVEEPALPLA